MVLLLAFCTGFLFACKKAKLSELTIFACKLTHFCLPAANHTDPSTDIIVGVVSYGLSSCSAGKWTVFSDIVSFNTEVEKPCGDLTDYAISDRIDAFLPCVISDITPGFNLSALASEEPGFNIRSNS